MTADEAVVLIEREDVYWNTERLAMAETLVALLGAAGLGAEFLRRGLADRDDRAPIVHG
jgi:hypothetical protein